MTPADLRYDPEDVERRTPPKIKESTRLLQKPKFSSIDSLDLSPELFSLNDEENIQLNSVRNDFFTLAI